MASKLAAAKIAAWSGVRAVIAARRRARRGRRRDRRAARSAPWSRPAAERLPSRKLWIAFARGAAGRVVVDDGARRALVRRRPLAARRPACATSRATFDADDAVEIVDDDGRAVRQGPGPMTRPRCAPVAGRRTAELADGHAHEVVHRDDLVVLPLTAARSDRVGAVPQETVRMALHPSVCLGSH